ncbi:TOTE conflict system archaeo-eukaryotic primase domain-containing protein [Alicyclobacillus mengziensis]|uniref:DEAD/DEAH box helicase family protein n=1 Tax=Alicyclobacillus mengziensis TaxID=2931921 RepID=A0A9X7VZQ0_9BACL|nr:DEAD/DEAH box helicase family protein [Alicyclobacillus mengziensis]QSO47517.1 DEAD/DEAH box helicase family protein [Alicyclobacillus mengziensis]
MRRNSRGSKQLNLLLPESSDIQKLMEENLHLQIENKRLRVQNAALSEELARLRQAVIADSAIRYPQETTSDTVPVDTAANLSRVQNQVTKKSAIHDKVVLFRSYFRGRDDVYAVRGREREGKAPYYPKRRSRRTESGEVVLGDTIPLTDDAIRAHLADEKNPVTIGLYPLLHDETCWLLAIDFDKSTWKDDSTAFMQTCTEFGVPAAMERSRSGNGGHVWIFFEEAVPARTARRLGSALLTHTLTKRHEVGLDSYDRMFPNQDTLPKGKKLGNLIALPFQRLAGKQGNSLFIDSDGDPYPDQWVYLSSVRKMSVSEVEAIVREAELRGHVTGIAALSNDQDRTEPWNKGPDEAGPGLPGILPNPLRLVLANMMYVQKSGLSSAQVNMIRRLAAFQNPEFYKAQAMRLSTYRKPRIIDCSEESSEYIALPRGCQDELVPLFQNHDIDVQIEDKRNGGSKIDVTFQGKLRDEQMKAARNLLESDMGTLVASTAFGKTVVGAWMIAQRGTNTLVLVDKTQLLEQWRERLAAFLNISTKEIGLIGGGRSNRTGRIDIALLQSVYTNRQVKDFVTEYGHIVVDECHHISAVSFEQVLKRATARYVLGLTATLVRKDGKHPIVLMQCGPVRYKTSAKSQAMLRPFDHVLIPRQTSFKLVDSESDLGISQIYDRLMSDESRNDMIFDDLLTALDQGRSPILLTERTAHLEYFEHRLKGFAKNIIVLRGGMGKKQLRAVQEKIKSIPLNEERVLLATGRYIGEGFDDERLDTLFLVMPISWKGTLQQYAGRLHRLHNQKDEVRIYDYVDDQVPMLEVMYQKRLKGYQAMGYSPRQG